MGKFFLIIIALQLGFAFQGCSTLKYLDGSSEKEIKISKLNKKKIYNDLQKQKAENETLKRQVNILREEYSRLQNESENKIGAATDENQRLTQQINELTTEDQGGGQDTKVLSKTKINGRAVQHENPSHEPFELVENLGALKIKVLSGDGQLDSAKIMAKKLKAIGCNVKNIDYAPRSDFLKTRLYFSPKFKNEAKYLSSCLGNNITNEPLSWSSMFDIIVVTGKNT